MQQHSAQSPKTNNQRCKLCLCNFKRLCTNLSVSLNRSGCKAGIKPLKTGHFQSLNWILHCSDFGRADFLAWELTWRVCPHGCCKMWQILQSICPAPDWPRAKNTNYQATFQNFCMFNNVTKAKSCLWNNLIYISCWLFPQSYLQPLFIYEPRAGIQTLMLPASFCLSILVYFKTVKSG